MKKLLRAAWLIVLIIIAFLFTLRAVAQEACPGNPRFKVKKTTEGFYEVINLKTNTLVGVFKTDPRAEKNSPPQPNAYPYLPGFPIYFPYAGISNANIADFFGTGEKEVAIGTGSGLHLYDSQGSEIANFPLDSADFDVSVYDYEKDGTNDICYYSYDISSCNPSCPYGINTADPYGNTLPNWPQWGPLTSGIDDVNNDGVYEVFSAVALQYPDNLITIYGFDEWGYAMPGWPIVINYEPDVPNSRPLRIAIADLDNDGQKEIITQYGPGTSDTRTITYAFHPDGSTVQGFPVTFNLGYPQGLVIADVDKDGWNEIIFSTGSNINLLSHEGVMRFGWPQKTVFINYESVCGGNRTCGGGAFRPVLADLNRDGILEIICGTNNGKAGTGGKALLFVFNPDGTYYPGWPKLLDTVQMSARDNTVGDVNGDCIPDLVYAMDNQPSHGLYAYNLQGSVLPNFPLNVSTWIASEVAPILTDLNSDGHLDIGITCEDIGSPWTTLEFFDLTPNPYNRSCIEWPMAHFDIRNTGRYRKLYQIDKTSSFSVDKTSVPADGESRMYLTACATTEGTLPSNFDGDLSGQDVRFARNPVNGTFTGPIIDHLDGNYSRYLVAPNSDDPLTTNLMCWINEFKLNTIIPVTFLGRPVVDDFSPRIVRAGQAYTISVTGRNYPVDVSAISDNPRTQLSGLNRISETSLELNVNVLADAAGYQPLRLFGYQRYSDPLYLIAYQPADLLLLGDKPTQTDAQMSWYGLDDPPGVTFRLTRATTLTFADGTVIYEGTDRNFTDSTAPAPILFYKVEPQ